MIPLANQVICTTVVLYLMLRSSSQQAFPNGFSVHVCRCRTCCASELAFKTFTTSSFSWL